MVVTAGETNNFVDDFFALGYHRVKWERLQQEVHTLGGGGEEGVL